jgi:uncharacterized repeat protein (TIGR01451 family)
MTMKQSRCLILCSVLVVGMLSVTNTAHAQVPGADLVISKATVPPGLAGVTAGNTITYRVTATNYGGGSATDLLIFDQTPSSTWYHSHAPSAGGVCSVSPYGIGGSEVTCTWFGSTANGGSRYFDLTVTVCSGTTDGYDVVSDMAYTSSNTYDPLPGNNQQVGYTGLGTVGAVTVPVTTQTQFQTIGSAAPYTVSFGGQVTFTIDIENLGPSTAPTTVITSLPSGWTVNSATTTNQGPCSGIGGNAAYCDLYLGGTSLCVGIWNQDTITVVADVPGSGTTGQVVTAVTVSSTNGQPDTGDLLVTIINVVEPVFYDGFESGNTSAWSSANP